MKMIRLLSKILDLILPMVLMSILSMDLVIPFPASGEAIPVLYERSPALMDLRTTFSDGAYAPETLVKMAVERGIKIIFLNDHDRMEMEYGLFPLRNIIKKKVALMSIDKWGASTYLEEIKRIRKKYPDVIIIPGTESAPFYYWTGSPFNGTLTANNHERRILTMGLEKAEDYKSIPVIYGGFSKIRLRESLLPLVALGISFLLGVYFLVNKGWWRIAGVILMVLNALFFTDILLTPASSFDQYHGDQGMAPYQLFIDRVGSRGGLTFWNYPETRSGVRKMGLAHVKTLPYPHALLETKDYTGFAAIYGDNITATEPGGVWDIALREYCSGLRKNPPWGIATSDYHKEGESGQKLGDFQTVLLLSEKSNGAVLDALKKGRMYSCRGNFPQMPVLEEFTVSDSEKGAAFPAVSGEKLLLQRNPWIRMSISGGTEDKDMLEVRLIRQGELVRVFLGIMPLKIDYVDHLEMPGETIFYRIDVKGYGKIVSNPVFVKFVQ